MSAALYNAEILRLATEIPHQARLSSPHASVEKRSPVCGSRVTVDVEMGPDGRIAAITTSCRAASHRTSNSAARKNKLRG